MICYSLITKKLMGRFYFFLWLRWASRVTLKSLLLAALFSAIITTFTYITQATFSLSAEIVDALVDIFVFWFPISWSIALLIVLFRSLKYIFNNCLDGYELKLLACNATDVIEVIGYGDLVKVWRRWFMLIIWLVGAQMVVAVFFTYMFSRYESVFEWFSIYWLFGFILSSGYFSFILLGARCKRVKVRRC